MSNRSPFAALHEFPTVSRYILATQRRKDVKTQRRKQNSVLGRENPRAVGCIASADWDGDGLHDLVFSVSGWHRDGSLFLLRNCGTKTEPLFEMPHPIRCFGEPIFVTRHGPHPGVGDVDGDGRPDVICSTEWSVYPFYRHTALAMCERPSFKLGDVRRVSNRGR